MTDQTKYRLNETSKIGNYFNQEINQRSKYVTAFDCIDQILIVLSATGGEVCIISSVSVAGGPVGIAGAIITLFFSLTTGIIKKIANHNKRQKEKAW